MDAFVNAAASAGVNVMFSPVSSPVWTGAANGGLPPHPQDFADFIGFMANRYKGRIAAYEVWNEQNYAVETGGAVNLDDPAAPYLPVLKAGYQTPKAVDPKITVVFGGMTPTSTVNVGIAIDEVQYLQKMYQR